MKRNWTKYLLLIGLIGCATQVARLPDSPPEVSGTSSGPSEVPTAPATSASTSSPTAESAETSSAGESTSVTLPSSNVSSSRRTPDYVITLKQVPPVYADAIALIKKWGNSDEFFAYFKGKRTRFSHFEGTVAEAIEQFRKCLEGAGTIRLSFYDPIIPSSAIGGWNGSVILQNLEHSYMTKVQRAGHLYHETTHMCGFVHKGNRPSWYDNENSFPYAAGYDFEDFLETKLAPAVAGE